jgi:hypothetical protein
MATAKDQMKTIQVELDRIKTEIQRLQAQEEILVGLLRKMSGEGEVQFKARKRATSVKPLVLGIMREAGTKGMTTSGVDEVVKAHNPSVAKDTVGSVLSRLKSDGALVYDGERYYDKQFAPKSGTNWTEVLRVVKADNGTK